MDNDGLDEFDVQVLRCCAGLSSTVTGWGAAVGEAASALRGKGLIDRSNRMTMAGRRFLEARGVTFQVEPEALPCSRCGGKHAGRCDE